MSDVDKGPAFFIISIVMYSVTVLLFGTRLIWRWRSKQRGMDDIMLACAVVCLTGQVWLILALIHAGDLDYTYGLWFRW